MVFLSKDEVQFKVSTQNRFLPTMVIVSIIPFNKFCLKWVALVYFSFFHLKINPEFNAIYYVQKPYFAMIHFNLGCDLIHAFASTKLKKRIVDAPCRHVIFYKIDMINAISKRVHTNHMDQLILS